MHPTFSSSFNEPYCTPAESGSGAYGALAPRDWAMRPSRPGLSRFKPYSPKSRSIRKISQLFSGASTLVDGHTARLTAEAGLTKSNFRGLNRHLDHLNKQTDATLAPLKNMLALHKAVAKTKESAATNAAEKPSPPPPGMYT